MGGVYWFTALHLTSLREYTADILAYTADILASLVLRPMVSDHINEIDYMYVQYWCYGKSLQNKSASVHNREWLIDTIAQKLHH